MEKVALVGVGIAYSTSYSHVAAIPKSQSPGSIRYFASGTSRWLAKPPCPSTLVLQQTLSGVVQITSATHVHAGAKGALGLRGALLAAHAEDLVGIGVVALKAASTACIQHASIRSLQVQL